MPSTRPIPTARWLDIIERKANVVYLAVEWDFQLDQVIRYDRATQTYIAIPFEDITYWRIRDSKHNMGRKRWTPGPSAQPSREHRKRL